MTSSDKFHTSPDEESGGLAAMDDGPCRLSDYYWERIDPENPSSDPELAAQLFRWTSAAVSRQPDEYTYRLGTLYTCGIGCEVDTDKAIDLYVEAYGNGDWRGAQAIAAMLVDFLDSNPDLPAGERDRTESEIERWGLWAEEMRRKARSNLYN